MFGVLNFGSSVLVICCFASVVCFEQAILVPVFSEIIFKISVAHGITGRNTFRIAENVSRLAEDAFHSCTQIINKNVGHGWPQN